MPKAIKYFINVLLLISFFICAVSFRNKLIISYLQTIFNMNYDVFKLQEASLYLLIIDHSWKRGPNPLYFMKTPLPPILPTPPFFKFCPTPLPCCLQPHSQCSFCCLVSLAEWVITPHLRCAILLNVSWMYTCQALGL